jgi:hypothetical protein
MKTQLQLNAMVPPNNSVERDRLQAALAGGPSRQTLAVREANDLPRRITDSLAATGLRRHG